MPAVSLDTLRQSVRSRVDMLDSVFVDDETEVDVWINEAGGELHDLVVSRYEDQLTIVSDAITVSSGNVIALSTLPDSAPFYKLRALDRAEDGVSDWREVRMFDFNARNRRATSGTSWYRSRDIRYRLVGANILLTPDDNATGVYRLWYIPSYVNLADPEDEVNWPQNWQDFIIASAAVKCLAKEESDTREQVALRDAAKARVLTMAAPRDAGGRMRIEDVRRRGYDDDDDGF